jgi:hypothetical protein
MFFRTLRIDGLDRLRGAEFRRGPPETLKSFLEGIRGEIGEARTFAAHQRDVPEWPSRGSG